MKFGRWRGLLLGAFTVTLAVKLLRNKVFGREENSESVSHEPAASIDFNICWETRVRIVEEGGVNVYRATKTYQSHAFKYEENTYACIVLTKREREAAN
jgi:hypothetical protein